MVEPGVDVLVVNYRTPGDLGHFAYSFARYLPEVPWAMGIANVQPSEDDLHMASKIEGDLGGKVFVMNFDENVGYARAVNALAAKTNREVLAIFNADTRFLSNIMDECCRELLSHPSWGILGPRQVNDQGLITSAGVFGTMEKPELRGWKRKDRGFSDVEKAVSVSGSAYFVKRELWDELTTCSLYQDVAPEAEGAFLPTVHYWEETFCSYHAISHKWDVIYYGPALMIHKWHQASLVGGWAERMMSESRKYFRRACDHHGIPHD